MLSGTATRERVQLQLHHLPPSDARSVIQGELAAFRSEPVDHNAQALPTIAAASKSYGDGLGVTSFAKALERANVSGTNPLTDGKDSSGKLLPRTGLPRVGQGLMDKYAAARHNTAIMGAMGHPGLAHLMAKDELEKKKRRERMKVLRAQQHERGRPKLTVQISSGYGIQPSQASPSPTSPSRMGLQRARSLRASTDGRRRHRKSHCGRQSDFRADSRVGKLLAEFKMSDDWVSQVVLRHALATIIQANVRGWLVRKRWRTNPMAVVGALKAAQDAARLAEERRSAVRVELELKAMTRKQKDKANDVVGKLFGLPKKGQAPGKMAGKWSRLGKNLEVALEETERAEAELGESDSDFSDLDVEDIALVKLRAKTPPWQKVEQSQWEGQWAKLDQKTQRGNLDVIWDLDDSTNRIEAVKQRRRDRGGAAARAEDDKAFNPQCDNLPPDLVSNMLLEKYIEKYTRLGLVDHMPLKGARLGTVPHMLPHSDG